MTITGQDTGLPSAIVTGKNICLLCAGTRGVQGYPLRQTKASERLSLCARQNQAQGHPPRQSNVKLSVETEHPKAILCVRQNQAQGYPLRQAKAITRLSSAPDKNPMQGYPLPQTKASARPSSAPEHRKAICIDRAL